MNKLIITILIIIITTAGVLILWNYQPDNKKNTIIASVDVIDTDESYIEKTLIMPEEILLDVPLLLQRPTLPTGCEIVSTAMMIEYNRIDISAIELAREIPYDENDPSIGYVGNPFTTGGWTIYPEALFTTVYNYLPTVQVMNEKDISQIKEQLTQEKPVVVWLSGMHGFTIHSVIISGYDQFGLFYNDPWSGEKSAWISNSDFLEMWADQNYRAISY
jgi:uncharacterized protein YvpB